MVADWFDRPRPSAIVPDAVPNKGGHNDLSRWKQFGGSLERPAAPASRTVKLGGFPLGCFDTCTTPDQCIAWGCQRELPTVQERRARYEGEFPKSDFVAPDTDAA